jgi:translation initiation factor 2 subunit 1
MAVAPAVSTPQASAPSRNYPEMGEFVIATVKKIMPYGAFLSLDEYPGVEGFLHISQVSSGWVRNIREHLREGQKTVAKVHTLDAQKGLIDLTLKQVTEADKRRKLESFQAEKKAIKLVEIVATKLKKAPAVAAKEVVEPLLKAYGSLAAGLEALHTEDDKVKLPEAWVAAFKELLDKEFKPKRIELRTKLTLKFNSGDGVAHLRKTLSEIETLADDKTKTTVQVKYLGAPNYYIDIETGDFRNASKALEKAEVILAKASKDADCDYSVEPEKR